MLRKISRALYCGAARVLADQAGSLPQLTWVLGATVITVLIIVALMLTMPGTSSSLFSSAVTWIQQKFGLQ